ncbi:hypothetical protein EDD15DRAFT_2371346 [Pisolithus albus]|nr:hypothetical protein EDD15DRAFT_2371346 [Pisolithus albus]
MVKVGCGEVGEWKDLNGSEREVVSGAKISGSAGMLLLHPIYEYPPPPCGTERKLDFGSPPEEIPTHRKYGERWALTGDPGSAPFKSSSSTRSNLSAHVSHALDFNERVDEIIWRRSSIIANSSLDPIFSTRNVEGLLSRRELWQKMIRSSSA